MMADDYVIEVFINPGDPDVNIYSRLPTQIVLSDGTVKTVSTWSCT